MIAEYARHNGHTDLITPARDAWVVLRRLINRGEVPTIPTVVTAAKIMVIGVCRGC